jgi:hypothetical protein
MSRTLIAIGLLFCAAVVRAAGGAAAPDPWYDVELLVFEYKGAPGDGSELWPGDPGVPDLDNVTDPVTSAVAVAETGRAPAQKRAAPPVPFQAVDSPSARMKTIEGRLARSPGYVPLLRLSWRQPIGAAPAKGVHVHGGPGIGEGVETIDGVVRLSRGRFLQAAVDLLYRKTAPDAAVTGDAFSHNMRQANVFRLQQAKRIRGGDVNYFDHPRFGAILLLTPFDNQAKKDTASGSESPGAVDE